MGLLTIAVAFLVAIFSGILLVRLMTHKPRWMGFIAFVMMLVGIIGGIALGFPASQSGRGLFIFGVVFALTAWTVAAPRLTSVILWSMIAALLGSSALSVIIPGDFLAVGIGIALAVSLIWVAFQFWCYWDKHGWRVASGLIAVSIISGIIAFTVPPSV